ncbi:GlxA family transcriptional regulator [Pseudonocardia sp. TRM90224]|uniref:GlxA family transcriptional regulator n=1 Tax=Pseudonocardia sp. TRM90224 TaxID=2812678 RepID=UPI001E2CD092|nr:DJ-1/PfpI family protein [Pseudonocardia sp. TRM90224]
MVRTVVFVVPAGVHLLDLAGPAQVFSTAHDLVGDYRLAYVGDGPVRCHQGIPLILDEHWPVLGARDIVVVPGWRVGNGPAPRPFPVGTLDRIRAHHAGGGRVASVCAGAFALADSGLLDGRRATTHHDVQDELARYRPAVDVVRDVLFVPDGRVYTSAGIASGIDLALHLVAEDHGPAVAARVARTLVVPARRNGSAPQASVMLRHRDHLADTVHRALDVLDARFADPLPLDELAAALGVSPRTLTRRFHAATGTTPLRYQHELRLEKAGELQAQGWSQDAAARAVGFTDGRMLRRLRSKPA